MKTGILVKKPENIFCNGCIQQSIFVKKTLLNAGFKCDMLSIEKNYDKFDIIDYDIKIIRQLDELKEYDIIFMLSLTLSTEDENQLNILRYIKQENIKLIDVICGNLFTLLQEEIVFNVHNILKNYINDYIDEYWVLEMYAYMKEYIELITNKTVKILDYVWDIDIIDTFVTKKMDFVNFNNMSYNSDKNNNIINIIIYEPNMSIHKNSLIPLLIAEKYYKKYKTVNKVYIFNGKKIEQSNKKFLYNLRLIQDNKIEIYDRIIMPVTLDLIQKNNNCKNVILSYTHMNNLNFLHLELFYLGYPIVHNCEPFKKNGLYYNDYELQKAVDCIESSKYHFKEDIKKNTKCILDEFSSSNKARASSWRSDIDMTVGKTTNNNTTNNNTTNKSTKNKTTEYKMDLIGTQRFYTGNGVVIFNDIKSSEQQDIQKFKQFLEQFKFPYIIIDIANDKNNKQEDPEIDYIKEISKIKFKKGIYVLASVILRNETLLSCNIIEKNEYKYINVFSGIDTKEFKNTNKI